MSAISKQERSLLVSANSSFFIGLFFFYDAIYSSFDLTFNLLTGTIGASLFIINIYWFHRSFHNENTKFSDEYLKHVYQNSYGLGAAGALIPLFIFMLFDNWLAQYFTIKYMAKLCIGTTLLMQGGYILWRNFIDNRALDKDEQHDEA